jgi:uncharacterized metal-binding protein YceD (DUF177 family)
MKVHLRQIPEGDTLHLEGEENAGPLGLEEAGAVPVSPLRYSLDVGTSDGGLFATGSLAVRVRMQCVACLEDFERDIVVDPFSLQMDLPGSESIDLTPLVREDIHLTLPAHPRCDSNGGPKCPASREGVPGSDRRPIPSTASAWDALDKLQHKSN